MTAASCPTKARPAHGMLPGSHEEAGGPTCRCGAVWGRWTDSCATQILEDLTRLATQIDEARQAANAIEIVAPTSSAYGDLSRALVKVLTVITGSAVTAELTYDSIIESGNTVSEALGQVAKDGAE